VIKALFFLILIAAFASMCTGCDAPTPLIQYGNEVDQAGNRYPVACHDVSDVRVDVVLLSREAMQARLPEELASIPAIVLKGQWIEPDDNSKSDGTIYIDKSLVGDDFYDAIKHEKCHGKMYHLTGSPRWHT
jgi:hypothetical protein